MKCSPGHDGGLPQWFIGRVFDAVTHKLLATMEEATPRFQMSGLTPGHDYVITITAVNSKGASDPQEIDAIQLKVLSDFPLLRLCVVVAGGSGGCGESLLLYYPFLLSSL